MGRFLILLFVLFCIGAMIGISIVAIGGCIEDDKVCTSGDKQCADNLSQVCNGAGIWETIYDCSEFQLICCDYGKSIECEEECNGGDQ